MKYFKKIALTIACVVLSAGVSASPLSVWDPSWTLFSNPSEDGLVGPGGGGQPFDAEYLYYKVSGNTLFLGLQTGFDIVDGHQTYGGKEYYSGDLALSFDGVTIDSIIATDPGFEYGIDFGLYTEGYTTGHKIDMGTTATPGLDNAGLYSGATWDNNLYSGHHLSDPFALDTGTFFRSVITAAGSGVAGGQTSYWRTVSFDATGLDLSNVDVHWTMSCGNDAINGHLSTALPEPSLLSLMGLGLLGLGFVRRRKAKV